MIEAFEVLEDAQSDQETPRHLSPKAFLAKVGEGRSIGTYKWTRPSFDP